MVELESTAQRLMRCPRTRLRLHQGGDALQTPDGRITYPIQEGVPDFRFDPPANRDEEASLDRLCAAAAQDGWREALRRHRPDLLGYVDNEQRTIFFDLLPLTDQTILLEIGTGLGQLLVPLGRRVRAAHGLELSPAQARFTALRARQEGRDNVFVAAGGDDLLLPFADEAFDLVVLNQVFEWIRLPEADGGALAGQRVILGEIFRVLKPGGAFFISTKNRYALRYLLGGADENARNVRFGNALPRWLMHKLAGRKTQGWLGLLHSHRGLRRLLTSAGFTDLKPYWAGPDPRFPKWYIPAETAAIGAARRQPGFAQGNYRSVRMLMPLIPTAILKHLTPGHTFLARKPSPANATPHPPMPRQVSIEHR